MRESELRNYEVTYKTSKFHITQDGQIVGTIPLYSCTLCGSVALEEDVPIHTQYHANRAEGTPK